MNPRELELNMILCYDELRGHGILPGQRWCRTLPCTVASITVNRSGYASDKPCSIYNHTPGHIDNGYLLEDLIMMEYVTSRLRKSQKKQWEPNLNKRLKGRTPNETAKEPTVALPTINCAFH